MSTGSNYKRIAKNTTILYVRMLVVLLISLYTTRLVLQTLGIEDYGLYNVVGGVVGMLGILTSLLSQGTSRFITISLGEEDFKKLVSTLSASITIHVLLAIFVFIVGEILGFIVLDSLNINLDRIYAAKCVYHITLISSIIGILQAPFTAAIIAHEKMSIYAYMGIVDVLGKFAVVFLLKTINIDKLILYSFLILTINVVTFIIYFLYTKKTFLEFKYITLKYDKKLYSDIINYTGWNIVGSLAYTANNQGITIVLNIFGTTINAARGIASSISNAIYQFIYNFQVASKPQIIKLYALGECERMNNLISKVSRFSAYLVLLLGIPIFIEMEYLLSLWLVDVPQYTVAFARLTIIQILIQSIDLPIGVGIHAVGKMKLPNLTSSFIYLIILPITYLGIKVGFNPTFAYLCSICAYPIALLMDMLILHKYTLFKIKDFILSVLLRILFFTFISGIVTYLFVNMVIQVGFIRLIITTIISSVLLLFCIYFYGVTEGEKQYVKSIIYKILHKISL